MEKREIETDEQDELLDLENGKYVERYSKRVIPFSPAVEIGIKSPITWLDDDLKMTEMLLREMRKK